MNNLTQYIADALIAQRDAALNQLAQSEATIRMKDDEIAGLRETIAGYTQAANEGRLAPGA